MIKKDNLRVLFIAHVGFVGGAEISLFNMVQSLHEHYQVYPLVVLPKAGLLKDMFAESGVVTIVVPMVPLDITRNPFVLIGYVVHLICYIFRVCLLIREYEIDLVHANTIKSGILVGLAAWLMRKPLVWHIRDYYDKGRIRTLIRLWAQIFATHIIVISKRVESMFAQLSHCSVIYNGIDIAAFDPAILKRGHESIRKELGLDKHIQIVGIIGQLSKWKGQHLFLLAAEKILVECPDVHFIIVGDNYERQDGVYKNELFNYVQERLLSESISFLGWCKDIVAIMGAIDVVVHLAKEEPFGRVVVEAMAAETVVIGANSGGLPEIIENDITGFLVPRDEVQVVAKTAVHLLRDTLLREKMGKNARIRAENHFSVHHNAKNVFRTYELIRTRKIS